MYQIQYIIVYELYPARRIYTEVETTCTSIKITEETTSGLIKEIPLTSIIGGVVEFKIAVLLVLSGILLICHLRPQ